MIEGAELNLYTNGEDDISLPLTTIQTELILTVLGFYYEDGNAYTYDDKKCKRIIKDLLHFKSE